MIYFVLLFFWFFVKGEWGKKTYWKPDATVSGFFIFSIFSMKKW